MDVKSFVLGYTKGKQSGSGGGGDSQLDALIDGTITSLFSNIKKVRSYAFYNYVDLTDVNFPEATAMGMDAFYGCSKLASANIPKVTAIPDYAFINCAKLTTANFPEATLVGQYAFQGCASLNSVNLPSATSIQSKAFSGCRGLTKVVFANLQTINPTYAFQNCSALISADFPALTYIGTYTFSGCSALTALILRNDADVSLQSTNALSGTPIANGTGYIYRPAARVDTDKAATNWSTYAAQFRALEDYTVDGTITGELDPNKI